MSALHTQPTSRETGKVVRSVPVGTARKELAPIGLEQLQTTINKGYDLLLQSGSKAGTLDELFRHQLQSR